MEQREQGFLDGIKDYPEIKVVSSDQRVVLSFQLLAIKLGRKFKEANRVEGKQVPAWLASASVYCTLVTIANASARAPSAT